MLQVKNGASAPSLFGLWGHRSCGQSEKVGMGQVGEGGGVNKLPVSQGWHRCTDWRWGSDHTVDVGTGARALGATYSAAELRHDIQQSPRVNALLKIVKRKAKGHSSGCNYSTGLRGGLSSPRAGMEILRLDDYETAFTTTCRSIGYSSSGIKHVQLGEGGRREKFKEIWQKILCVCLFYFIFLIISILNSRNRNLHI